MGIGEATGKTVAWVKNGGKKELGKYGVVSASSVMATIIAIQQIFGPLSGLAEINALKQKADTVVTMVEKMSNFEKKQDKQDAKLDNIQSLLITLASKQGVRVDTVVVTKDSSSTAADNRPR